MSTDQPTPQPVAQPIVLLQAQPPAPPAPKGFNLADILAPDKSDVTAIVVSTHETALRQQVSDATKRLATAQNQLEAANTAVENLLAEDVKTAESLASAHYKNLFDAFTAHGYKPKVNAEVAFSNRTSTTTFSLADDESSATKNPRQSLRLSIRITINNFSYGAYRYDELREPYLIQFRALADAEASINAIQAEIEDLRKRLGNMSSLERQARAAMATHALKATGAIGDQLLETLQTLVPAATLPEQKPLYLPNTPSMISPA